MIIDWKENIFIMLRMLCDGLEGSTDIAQCEWAKLDDKISRMQSLRRHCYKKSATG